MSILKSGSAGLPQDRLANIEIVSSAYASVIGSNAYLSMPITTGKRFYDVLARYHVRDAQTLEWLWPGALYNEIMVPNLEEGRSLAEKLSMELNGSLICPGIFEARKQQWTQKEYMILWGSVIESLTKEIYLSDGWEYSDGDTTEFAQALEIKYLFVEGREDRMAIFDHTRQRMNITEATVKMVDAIKSLERRGFATNGLRAALSRGGDIAGFECEYLTSRDELEYHFGYGYQREFDGARIREALRSIK